MTSTSVRRGRQSTHLNEALVHSACTKLAEQQIKPTVSSVRAHLGITRGSNSTAQKWINSWWDLGGAVATVAGTPELPEPLQTACESLWQSALLAANQQLESERQQLKANRKSLAEERLSLAAAMQDNEEALSTANNQAHLLESELAEKENVLQLQNQTIDGIRHELTKKTSEVEQLEEGAKALERELSSVREHQLTVAQQLQQANASLGQFQQMQTKMVELHEQQMRARVLQVIKEVVGEDARILVENTLDAS